MAHLHPAVTISVRISPEIRYQLEELSDATGRTKSFLAAEGIKNYLASQSWQIKGIKDAIKKADSKNAKFIDNSEVIDWVKSWGSDQEKEMPK